MIDEELKQSIYEYLAANRPRRFRIGKTFGLAWGDIVNIDYAGDTVTAIVASVGDDSTDLEEYPEVEGALQHIPTIKL